MSIEARRWVMTAVKAPLECVAFTAAPGPGEVAGRGGRLRRLPHRPRLLLRRRADAAIRCRSTLGHEISGRVVAAGAGAEGLDRPGGGRAGRHPVRQVRRLPRGPRRHLPRAGDARQRRRRRLRDARRRAGAAGLCPVDGPRLASGARRSPSSRSIADAVTTPYQAVVARGLARRRARDRRRRRRRGRLRACRSRRRSARASSRSTSTPTNARARSRRTAPR